VKPKAHRTTLASDGPLVQARPGKPCVRTDVIDLHYIYALTDYREIDPQPAFARLFT
jgi:hypothetical protein